MIIVAGIVIIGAIWALFPPTNSQAFDALVGKQAPDFNLQTYDGNTVELSNYIGRNIVLFFSEGINCQPACTNQMTSLDNDPRFNTASVAQFSVVVDQKSAWVTMMSQEPSIGTSLLFDSTKTASSAYGVLTLPSSMHPGLMPGHSYVIIDKQGIVRFTFDDPAMGINNDKLASDLSTLS